jgi:hypothetical protein
LDCANGVGALWINKYLENSGFICKKALDIDTDETDNLKEDEDVVIVNLFNTNTTNEKLLNNGVIKLILKIYN